MTEIRRAVEGFASTCEAGGRILDVGCGLRPYEHAFAHCNYVGIDVEASGREAESKLADSFFDGVKIGFDDETFEAALCTQVLEHAVEPDLLVRDIHRVLKPGGRLLVTVPFIWGEHEVPFDFRRFSTFGARCLIEQAGFAVERLDRLSSGVEAIAMLVSAEMIHDPQRHRVETTSSIDRSKNAVARRLSPKLWRLQLRLWRRIYSFDRIYIDNLVEARKAAPAK